MRSRHAAIEAEFGDGTYTFRLGLDEIEELERRRDLSLFALARRLSPQMRDARLADISETLRCGLIGGGMAPVAAMALVRRHVDERPVEENRDVAYAVVLAGLTRVYTNEEAASSGEASAAKTGAAKTGASTSPPSADRQS